MWKRAFSYLLIITTALLVSCGKSTEEEINGAILSANISLGKGNCQQAIDTLNAISYQDRNAAFLKTLSSAYACRAGFSVVTYFASDISKTVTPTPLGGMATYSSSALTITGALENNSYFSDLQHAIDILLYAGGFSNSTEPTAAERAKYFDSKDASEINTQLTWMIMAQLGRYMRFYGNSSSTGVKGSGSGANVCYTDYSLPSWAAAYIAASGAIIGHCNSASSSHTYLNSGTVASATRIKRLCQGVVLMNSMFDSLPYVLASASGGDLSSVSTVTSGITTLKSTLVSNEPSVGQIAVTQSQSNCETVGAAAGGQKSLEAYFLAIFEGSHQ